MESALGPFTRQSIDCTCAMCRLAGTITEEETAEILEEAAAYMERHGWTQNVLEDNLGRVCLMGAVSRAAALHYHNGMAVDVFTSMAGDLFIKELGVPSPPAWNDSRSRTMQEVLDLLHRTAKHVLGVEG